MIVVFLNLIMLVYFPRIEQSGMLHQSVVLKFAFMVIILEIIHETAKPVCLWLQNDVISFLYSLYLFGSLSNSVA